MEKKKDVYHGVSVHFLGMVQQGWAELLEQTWPFPGTFPVLPLQPKELIFTLEWFKPLILILAWI